MISSFRNKALLVAAIGIAVSATFTGSIPATADVGDFKVQPTVVAPGEEFELSFSAAWLQRFPVSMVPMDRVPTSDSCGNDIRTPIARKPPRGDPFVSLGPVGPDPQSSRGPVFRYLLRARLPKLPPGDYAFVAYCEGCYEGPGGSMIASAHPDGDQFVGDHPVGTVLRVRASNAVPASSTSGSGDIWWIAAAVSILASVGIVVLRRSRRSDL